MNRATIRSRHLHSGFNNIQWLKNKSRRQTGRGTAKERNKRFWRSLLAAGCYRFQRSHCDCAESEECGERDVPSEVCSVEMCYKDRAES